ncbi:MAG: HAMP domain-containing sensor histidine kinase [Lachnospiraceae bacterium]|nr:HAMP domain-containing sensor histidine kinase [Lachnospiraceae bacterium]
MKKALYLKFIFAYMLLAFVGVFVTAALGGGLIEKHLTQQYASHAYNTLNAYSESHISELAEKGSSLRELYSSLKALTAAYDGDARVIGTKGTELIYTAETFDPENPRTISGFDYTKFGPQYYEVSTFFDQYSEVHLNVMVPVTYRLSTLCYLEISVPMTIIEEERDVYLSDCYVVTMVNFCLSLFLLLLFTLSVYRPLMKITEGAREFSNGNLNHRIQIHTSDEMGYLADTMNFMADELRKNNDYQKKFISNISHDLRSPLTSIKGFSEAMIDGTIPPEMHEKYLKIISGESDRLVKLTREVLALNQMDSDQLALTMENFDINAMLKKTAAVFEGSCRKKKITIQLVLSGEVLLVNADPERIEQVIYNLLDNAIKFSDKNSAIKLETTEKRGKIYVSVKDEGCGISREHLSKIWDRFYKADSSRGRDRSGTGLGLSIVKEIITAHGQTITVVSTENVGTEFVFTLKPAGN